MSRYLKYILIFGPALFFADIGQAQSFTLKQAVSMALERSPEIRIAGEQADQTEFAVDEAEAIYYPQVDVFAEAGREYNSPASTVGSASSTGGSTNSSVDATLSINQFLFDGFQTQEEIDRRKQLIQSAEIQGVRVEEQIIITTIEAYTSILQFQRANQDANEFIDRLEEIETKLVLMVEAGAESEAKLKYLQARLASARQNKIGIRSDLADAKTDLEKLVGVRREFEAQHPASSFIVLEDIETYYQYAQGKNKEIQVNKSDKQALEHQLESLYGQEYPSFNALVELNQNHDVGGLVGRDRNASAMLQVNYRIFDGFSAEASRKRVTSQIRELDHRIEQATRDVNQRLKLLYNQIQSLKNEWLVIEQEIEANDGLRVLNQEQFQLGEGDILELVESEERYFSSRIKKHKVEFDFTQTIHQLNQQAGLLKKDEFLNPND